MDTKELLDKVAPTIGELGSAFYFVPETMEAGKAIGLGGMEFYVQGRGGQMGDTAPEAVAAAFGYFKPSLVKSVLDAAQEKITPRAAGAAHLEACAALGRAKLAAIPNIEALAAVLGKINDAADPEGLALYAAIRTETLATDAPGRAMQLIAVLREFRGSAHLVALRAVGLKSSVAHYMKRPDMWKMFGYTDEDAPEVDDSVHRKLEEAERITDFIVEPAFAVLDDNEQQVLIDGLEAVKTALAA